MPRQVRGKWQLRPEAADYRAKGAETAVTLEDVRPGGPPPPEPPPPDRLLWPWLFVALLLIAGVAVAYFATRDAHSGRRNVAPTRTVVELRTTAPTTLPAQAASARTSVPRVVGLSAPEALKTLHGLGLTGRTSGVFSAKPRNQVISQTPGAGRKLDKGATVTLTVSKGKKTIAVPDVVGQSAADALATLRAQNLVATLARVPSDQPAGQVVAQHPKAGETAPADSRIRLNVSDASRASTSVTTTTTVTTVTTSSTTTATTPPRPSPAPVTVPDVTGKQLADARAILHRLGLIIEIRQVPSSLPEGEVVAQARRPGSTLKRGDHMLVTVSLGP